MNGDRSYTGNGVVILRKCVIFVALNILDYEKILSCYLVLLLGVRRICPVEYGKYVE